jgi:hypothetical protein
MAARAAARLDARMVAPRRAQRASIAPRRIACTVGAFVAGCACFGAALAAAPGIATYAGIACIFSALGALCD